MLWCILLSIVFVVLVVMKFVPVRKVDLIEGNFIYARETREMFTDMPLMVYHFKNYCRSCLEGNIKLGGTVWNCHETIPAHIWTIGEPPRENESVRLTVYFNIYGTMLIAKWTRTDFKLDPVRVELMKAQINVRRSMRNVCNHG